MEKIYSGYIKDFPDSRRYKTNDFFAAAESFDWEKGFDIEEKLGIKLSVNDQGESFSCVGQAKSKDREIKEFIETGKLLLYSARSIYSLRPNRPGEGMNLSDACKIEQEPGVALRADAPDSGDEGSMNILPPAGTPRSKSERFMVFNFWNNIDALAQHIKDFGCVMIAYDGKNNGTNYLEHPRLPISSEEVQWAHCVLACKAKQVNGEKRVYFINSWGEKAGIKGWQYFTEEDLKIKDNGYSPFYQGYVTIDLKNHNIMPMVQEFLKNNEGRLIQDTDKDGTGEIATIVKGTMRRGTLQQVIGTYLVRKEGTGTPREIWDELKKTAKPL